MCGKVVYHAMLMLNRLHRWCICYNTVKKLPMSQKITKYAVCAMLPTIVGTFIEPHETLAHPQQCIN